MEPVEDVLGTPAHTRGQVAHRVAAIGEERDVLVHLNH